MKIEKLSQKIEFDVEAQGGKDGRICRADCYTGSEWTGNNWFYKTFYNGNDKMDCKRVKYYSSWITTNH